MSQKKFPPLKLSVTLSNINRFSKFLHCWKVYEISNLLQNPYDTTHLTLGMLLHYLGKLKIRKSFVANFIRFSAVQKFSKSVNIGQSYRELKGGNFFERRCSGLLRKYQYWYCQYFTDFCNLAVREMSKSRTTAWLRQLIMFKRQHINSNTAIPSLRIPRYSWLSV